MKAHSVQDSIDEVTAAANLFPYSYKFRTAQAKQLYVLSERIPELVEPAERAMRYALAADRHSLELLGNILILRLRLHDCDGVEWAGKRLLALAPNSNQVQNLVNQRCQNAG